MNSSDQGEGSIDFEALSRKYAEERAKRLRADAIGQYQAPTGKLSAFARDTGCECDDTAWFLMVAHLLQIQAAAANGGGGSGPVASATVGGVSVSFQAPPYGSSAYKFWLFTTPFGAQLAALIARCSAGGVYVGGAPERAAFRQVGGGFPNRGRLWLR